MKKSRTQRKLENAEQAARLRKQNRQNDLKRAQAESEDARIGDTFLLLEFRSQLLEEGKENDFEEAQSIVSPNSENNWIRDKGYCATLSS